MTRLVPNALVSPSAAEACTTTAADASYSAVSSAYSSTPAGGVVCVPVGSATWTSTLTLAKAITLQGAGAGQTIITASGRTLLSINPSSPSSDPAIRVTGFTFDGADQEDCIQWSNNSATFALSKIRVDHNTIRNCNSNGVYVSADVWGLIDNNDFSNNDHDIRALGNDTESWVNFPANAGSGHAPYIESNRFSHSKPYTFLVESGQGGRYVFRYNTVTETSGVSGFQELLDAHGNNGPWPANRGTVETEVYGNTFTLSNTNHRLMNLRGGDTKVFNNVITTGDSASLEMTEYDGWSYHIVSARPAYDPIQNAFYFNNTVNGTQKTPSRGHGSSCGWVVCDSDLIVLGLDYFLPAFGPIASRPVGCIENTYYGASDTGVISKCLANSWNLVYTPLPFPHPLATGGGSVVPSAPRNLRITPSQ